MRARRVAALLAVLALSVTGCSSLHGTGDTGFVSGDGTVRTIPVADRGDPVTLSGKGLDGEHLSLASLRGKPTVVTTWGSWCVDCRKDAPNLVGAAKRLGNIAHFVGIDSRDYGTAQPKAFNARFHITWPSFYSPGGKALLAFPGVLSPNAIPATVILDARGRPAARITGAIPSELTLVEIVRDVARHG